MTELTEPRIVGLGLTKRYPGGQLAVDNLDFSIAGSEVACLLGAPGCGKTTALGMVTARVRPTAGRALLMGLNPVAEPIACKRNVTVVTDRAALYESMSLRENLAYFASLGRPVVRPSRADCLNAMRRAGLPDRAFELRARHWPKEWAVCLWFAIAHVRDSPVLILDEPTRGLDAKAVSTVEESIAGFKTHGTAVFLATSDVFFASRVADSVIFLEGGRKVTERPGSQMRRLSLDELSFAFGGRRIDVANAASAVVRPV